MHFGGAEEVTVAFLEKLAAPKGSAQCLKQALRSSSIYLFGGGGAPKAAIMLQHDSTTAINLKN